MDLFNVSALQPDGPRDPSQQFQADGRVFPLPVLDDKGLAADTVRGTVDFFNVSALQPDGPKDPFQQLRANDEVLSLAVLDDKNLQLEPTVALRTSSA